MWISCGICSDNRTFILNMQVDEIRPCPAGSKMSRLAGNRSFNVETEAAGSSVMHSWQVLDLVAYPALPGQQLMGGVSWPSLAERGLRSKGLLHGIILGRTSHPFSMAKSLGLQMRKDFSLIPASPVSFWKLSIWAQRDHPFFEQRGDCSKWLLAGDADLESCPSRCAARKSV